MSLSDIELSLMVSEEEQLMVEAMAEEVLKTSTILSGKGLRRSQ